MNEPSEEIPDYLKYPDGQTIQQGDVIIRPSIESEPKTISSIYAPGHKVSRYYEHAQGCIEMISPPEVLALPVDGDTVLLSRKL